MARAYVKDGDVGCGAPGTPTWHKCAVAELSSIEVMDYLMEAFSMDAQQIAEIVIEYRSTDR